jgi:hypothetical protein
VAKALTFEVGDREFDPEISLTLIEDVPLKLPGDKNIWPSEASHPIKSDKSQKIIAHQPKPPPFRILLPGCRILKRKCP